MTMNEPPSPPDRPTLIAISTLAYIAAVGLHEHIGHTLACLMLGSHPTEVGAFYVNCSYTGMSDASIRLVALAGPLVSLLTGILSFLILHRQAPRASSAYYFIWLLGSIGFMSATGYLLFSGITGIGDFGTGRDGLFYQAAPEWLWRIGLTLVGVAGYYLLIKVAVRYILSTDSAAWAGRVSGTRARRLALTSYLTGAVVSVVIGLLNPHGLIIVVTSATASSLGATSGLLWMMQLLDRNRQVLAPGLTFQRSWWWITSGVILTAKSMRSWGQQYAPSPDVQQAKKPDIVKPLCDPKNGCGRPPQAAIEPQAVMRY